MISYAYFFFVYLAGQKVNCPGEIWSTLVALSYLKIGLAHLRDSWLLVADKGDKWIGTKQVDGIFKEKAVEFVNAKLKR